MAATPQKFQHQRRLSIPDHPKSRLNSRRALLLSPTGSWADQNIKEEVTITLPDASVYTGGIKNGLFHGRGVRNWPDGNKYDGEYAEGLASGRGVLSLHNGDRYEGQFKRDLYNGTGVFIRASHNRYEGEFKDGAFEGIGFISFGDGAKAQGQFKAWELNGTGTCVYASGTKTVGEFKNGRLDGMGRMQYADGEIHEGMFKNGVLNGKGLVVTPSGRSYQGFFKNGKFEGGNKPSYGGWSSKSWMSGWDPVFDTTTAGKPSFWLPVLLAISLLFNLIQALSGRSKNWFQPQLAEKRPPDYSGVLKDTERFEKIVVLENEVQAEALDALLAERGVPHEMKSYRDSALDGVYQSSGWGHVAAPQAHAAAVLQALKDLSIPPDTGAPV
jgi:hypothetical protein